MLPSVFFICAASILQSGPDGPVNFPALIDSQDEEVVAALNRYKTSHSLRVWKSRSGSKLSAYLHEFDPPQGKVVLRKKDDSVISVEIQKLSDTDKLFLSNHWKVTQDLSRRHSNAVRELAGLLQNHEAEINNLRSDLERLRAEMVQLEKFKPQAPGIPNDFVEITSRSLRAKGKTLRGRGVSMVKCKFENTVERDLEMRGGHQYFGFMVVDKNGELFENCIANGQDWADLLSEIPQGSTITLHGKAKEIREVKGRIKRPARVVSADKAWSLNQQGPTKIYEEKLFFVVDKIVLND